MIYLILSILVSSSLFVIFKLFDRFHVNTFNAIVMNYVIACATGMLLYDHPWKPGDIIGSPWFPGTIFLGVLFIIIFMVMARTAQQIGLSVASVAGKMSLIIPVAFGILAYKESLNPVKITGIILALAAVYMVSVKKEKTRLHKKDLLLPVLLFVGSGVIDTTLKYLESKYVAPSEFPLYSSSIFGIAAIIGAGILLFRALRHQRPFRTADLIGGIALGIPNYFSIYFLLKALGQQTMESSVVFSVNNVAIVMLSTLLGIALFGEKLKPRNWAGVVLAIVSIILISLPKT